MSITSGLVKLIRSKPHTEEDLKRASILFLDALACAYAGSNTPAGKKLLKWAGEEPMNTRSSAFLVGALTHITETDDLHRDSVTHPGCIVVPCLMALGPRTDKSDSALLVAMLRGFESMCRVGNAVGPQHYKVWHNTATCGPFGSAMAAAEVLDLDDEQTLNALGNAGTQSSGLWQFLETGAMSKHLHAGRGSEAGVLAAELARGGFTGPPEILEGKQGLFVGMCPDPEPGNVLRDAEAAWQLVQTSIKPWPSCRHTHPTIDAALEISASLGNRVIESVRIDTYQSALDICDRRVASNEYQAKFSLQHCVSKALLDGEVTLTSFNDAARSEVAPMCEKISVNSSEPYRGSYPQSWGAAVTVKTSDGDELVAKRAVCKGDPELPLNDQDMLVKAKSLLAYGGLDDTTANSVCDQVMNMPYSQESTPFMQEFLSRTL